ncbi:hypothetical protein, partial [Leptospira interrogans]|uniref:hypothetical protein n=1 Tax=Leptospira interrogans TaxID=173 RepID=UPI001F2ADF53
SYILSVCTFGAKQFGLNRSSPRLNRLTASKLYSGAIEFNCPVFYCVLNAYRHQSYIQIEY